MIDVSVHDGADELEDLLTHTMLRYRLMLGWGLINQNKRTLWLNDHTISSSNLLFSLLFSTNPNDSSYFILTSNSQTESIYSMVLKRSRHVDMMVPGLLQWPLIMPTW
jgi:hypothetical protein